MNESKFEFLLEDRITKVQMINEQYNLIKNSYISLSGGKDSMIVSTLIDIALPNNKIPRVFANTGIEYNLTVKFIKKLSTIDNRVVIVNQTNNIRKTLTKYGYPFKSKEHSLRVEYFNKGSNANYLYKYINNYGGFSCPECLKYQFVERGRFNYSNKCCYKLKKNLLKNWQSINNKKICITGMRQSEGGNRKHINCLTQKQHVFNPIAVCDDDWIEWFLNKYSVMLSELYYPPFNFIRTGCKGCPFNLNLQNDLKKMYILLPNEYFQCIELWKPVYDEYIRIGYRLKQYPHLMTRDRLNNLSEEVKQND